MYAQNAVEQDRRCRGKTTLVPYSRGGLRFPRKSQNPYDHIWHGDLRFTGFAIYCYTCLSYIKLDTQCLLLKESCPFLLGLFMLVRTSQIVFFCLLYVGRSNIHNHKFYSSIGHRLKFTIFPPMFKSHHSISTNHKKRD